MSTPVPASLDETVSDWSASAAFSVFNETGASDGNEVTRGRSTVASEQPAAAGNASDTEAAVSQIGRTIEGKYRLDAVIGTGGMGSVYRASRLLIGDLVAIKLLHNEHIAEAQSSERFRREAQAAGRLKHPNVVPIYDFGVTNDGLVYLVMELVEGQSLRRVIKEQGPLKPVVAADIINQICAALDEAHRQQIIHRDLKPDNIIVNSKITSMQVKVLDFGIAKLRDVKASNLTQTGSIMGTPHYMSPEQCLGEELDNRSDIYSLGIVLYEMLAGVVPFNSPISMAVVVQHVNQEPPTLRGVNLSISPAAEAAVMHALAKKREDRPQSASAFAAEFSAAVAAGLPHPGGGQAPRTDLGGGRGMNPTLVLPRTTTGSVPAQPGNNSRYLIPLLLVGALLLAVGVIVGLLIDANNKKRESDNPANVSTPSTQNDNTADNQTMGQSSSTPEPDRRPSPTPANVPSPTVAQNSPPPMNSNTGLSNSFTRDYRGTINGSGLAVRLTKSGPSLTGRAETKLSWDQLQGTIEPDGRFTLYGSERGGPVKGKYTGQMHPDGSVTNGVWTSTENGKQVRFYLK